VNPANAYARTAQQTLSGRDLEAHVLLKSAARLQAIRDDWDARGYELDEALTKNRKIWTVFIGALTAETCPLPNEVRSNLVNLGIFVLDHTLKITVGAKPEQLGVLININREIAAGLRGDGGARSVAA
jgi:flagellar biosynthesis activator protein FlaF